MSARRRGRWLWDHYTFRFFAEGAIYRDVLELREQIKSIDQWCLCRSQAALAAEQKADRSLHTGEVVGSIPTAPTIEINMLAFVSCHCAHVSLKRCLRADEYRPMSRAAHFGLTSSDSVLEGSS
jgi:hypothetical protein